MAAAAPWKESFVKTCSRGFSLLCEPLPGCNRPLETVSASAWTTAPRGRSGRGSGAGVALEARALGPQPLDETHRVRDGQGRSTAPALDLASGVRVGVAELVGVPTVGAADLEGHGFL